MFAILLQLFHLVITLAADSLLIELYRQHAPSVGYVLPKYQILEGKQVFVSEFHEWIVGVSFLL